MMNMVTRLSNSLKSIIGKVLPMDKNNDGTPDSVAKFEKSVNDLLMGASSITLSDVYMVCRDTSGLSVEGEEKRKIAFRRLRAMAKDCASYILYAAIEAAVGRIEKELRNGNSQR